VSVSSQIEIKKQRPLGFLLDLDTGHVLPPGFSKAAISRKEKSKKYENDFDGWVYHLNGLSTQTSQFVARGESICAFDLGKDPRDKIQIIEVLGYPFALYSGEDCWGNSFLNCVLITRTEAVRKQAAVDLGLRPIVGLTEWLFSNVTGLIDAYALETIERLLERQSHIECRSRPHLWLES